MFKSELNIYTKLAGRATFGINLTAPSPMVSASPPGIKGSNLTATDERPFSIPHTINSH